jgi:endonuclease YncB( thermonuclease family)
MVGVTMTNRVLPLLVSLAAALGFGVACAAQERIEGRAKVVDGDSLEIGTTHIRLFGVDAPEGRQSCTRGGREWACGAAAAAELRRLVGARAVACLGKDHDDYGRTVAVCTSGGTDLGAAMVRAGLALAYRHYSTDYVADEAAAHAARRGVWAGDFTPPRDWRREDHDAAGAAAAAGAQPPATSRRGRCAIKGNINRQGARIYHVPGSASYDDTVIDERQGERWFCSEEEARRAGWRAPRGR